MGQDSETGTEYTDGDCDRATHLTLKIGHQYRWTLRTTASVDAGLLAHSVHEYDRLVNARVTAYADTQAD